MRWEFVILQRHVAPRAPYRIDYARQFYHLSASLSSLSALIYEILFFGKNPLGTYGLCARAVAMIKVKLMF